jgi:hypothetical protein
MKVTRVSSSTNVSIDFSSKASAYSIKSWDDGLLLVELKTEVKCVDNELAMSTCYVTVSLSNTVKHRSLTPFTSRVIVCPT